MGLSIVTAYSVCRKHFSNVFLPEIRYRQPAMNAARLNRKKAAAMMFLSDSLSVGSGSAGS